MMERIFLLLGMSFILFGFIPARGQLDSVDHWEAVVKAEQEWRYFPGTSEPPPTWRNPGFDDSSWLIGAGGIGYGDGDDATVIDAVISLYMRRKFTIQDTGKIKSMVFNMDFDDAFVAYINNQEIARSHIGTPGIRPSYDEPASGLHEAQMYQGHPPEEYLIEVDLMRDILIQGENVLAIQVHNRDISSSDLSAISFLTVGISDTSHIYLNLPTWFTPPIDYSVSQLPIIAINTMGQAIDYESRIRCNMGIIDNGPGVENHINDTITGYNGWINIEIRGESTQGFPKKSYGFETQDNVGENNNVSLLGIPVENDWILYAPYSDKSLIRNVLTYKLTRDMGRYATRTEFCELFINDKYEGLYVLMEKIKRDNDRVDIANLREIDIEGDQLTGGYILRVDKIDDNDYPPWESGHSPQLSGTNRISFQYNDPDGRELRSEQKQYIKNFIREFESALSSSTFLDGEYGYHKFVDKSSFADFLIINELSKEVDSYLFSVYMHKDRDSFGGKLTMGPVWDFNLGYANTDYCENGVDIPGWVYDDSWRMYWFRRMMQDFRFRNVLNCRWHELRTDAFSDQKIIDYIDSITIAVEVPIQKNFNRWPVLGAYVWPNYFVGNTHQEEIDFLKTWLLNRLHWMDANIPESCVLGFPQDDLIENIKIYPNPFTQQFIIDFGDIWTEVSSISLYDIHGRLVMDPVSVNKPECLIRFDQNIKNDRAFIPGMYIMKIEKKDGTACSRKVISN
ncbi:CotH kinase family protein [Bacteroidota bacterium]